MMHFKRYPMKNPILTSWVQFIWHFKTETSVSINNKLLPTDSIDIIISKKNKIEYVIDNHSFEAAAIHFSGMRHKPRIILQEGFLNVFGISFSPYGLYPFLHVPLSRFNTGIVNLKECNQSLEEKLSAVIATESSPEETIHLLEKALVTELALDGLKLEHIQWIEAFRHNHYEMPILQFCQEHNVNVKAFERACLKYTGYTPKALQRIGRFQATSNQLIFSNQPDSYAELACMYDYYDQAHFIREFQAHTGVSPNRFIQEGSSIKENAKLI